MASIVINEIDRSTYLNKTITNNNAVVIAGSHTPTGTWAISDDGTATFTAAATDLTEPKGKFVLCTSLREFMTKFGNRGIIGKDSRDNTGWEMAANILRAGLPVIYYSYYKGSDPSQALLARKNNGSIPKASSTGVDGIDKLYDKIQYRFRFIPTIYDDNNSNTDLINLANDRKDCTVLLDYNNGNADPGSGQYTPTLAVSRTGYSRVVVASPGGLMESSITGDTNIVSTDESLKSTLYMPPSFWILKTIGEYVSSGSPIYSIFAGAKNGRISGLTKFVSATTDQNGNLTSVTPCNVSNQVMDEWTESLSVIPLMNVPPYGNLIYGNSTRLNVGTIDGSEVTPPNTKSALDSFNVVNTLNEIYAYIFEICLGLRFDTNDSVLWNEFRVRLGNKLRGMQTNRAINDYLIVMDNSTVTSEAVDALTVPGVVFVDVSRAAEKFRIEFNITPSGAVFSTEE